MSSKPFVVFPHCSWRAFPFQKLLLLLSRESEVWFVHGGSEDAASSLPPSLSPLSRSRLGSLPQQEMTAIVTHPYWVADVAALQPARLVVMLPHPSREEETPLWETCWRRLTALADLVCTESETRYLDQSFRAPGALFLQGENSSLSGDAIVGGESVSLRDYEVLFLKCMRELTDHGPSAAAQTAALQWSLRADYYGRLREQAGAHETISFLLAVYLYLLGSDSAKRHLIESFQQAATGGKAGNSLHTHYRFLSAIHAKLDELEKAVTVYGITAVSEPDTIWYEHLCRWMEQGQRELVRGELYRLNDDFRSAIQTLGVLDPSSAEARRLGLRTHLAAGNMEAALACLDPEELTIPADKRDYLLLCGIVLALKGKRHEAIHRFLEAALDEEEALAQVLEMKAVDQALERIGGESDD
ncbi:tetratricopeptide repeat protein [Paenibacillus konkukensis]|nr:hypothetical protein [Paenibacillus konkukensis]